MTAPSSGAASHHVPLNAARRQVEQLAALERRYLDAHPYRLVHAYDPRAGRYTVRVEVQREVPDEARTLISEVLRGARDGLDGLAVALSSRGDAARPPRFPIHDSLPEFAQRSRRALAGMSAEDQATIEELQPYHTFGGYRNDRLWLLRELSAGEPALAAGALRGDSNLGVNTARHVEITDPLEVEEGAFDQDGVLVSVSARVTGPDPKLDLFFTPNFDLAFAAHGPARGAAVVATLGAILDRIEREVVPRFALRSGPGVRG